MAARVELAVVAKNQASSVLKQVGADIRGLGSEAGKAKNSLSDMFNVAGGQMIANGIASITRSLVGLGAEALSTYSDFERLTMSLETFAARELVNAGVTGNMATALEMSGERAKELLSWIEKVAVQSPFNSSDIASAFRTAQAYGFTSDQAMRLTQATVDFAAGAGISGPMMDRITLALGQIAARGKVSSQELNQLSEAGIGARQILAQAFGVSTAEIQEMIEKGLVPAGVAIEAITQSLEKDFGGAAQRQANTFSGLISSLEDLKSIGLRDFFAGTFQSVQPYLKAFVDTVTDPTIKQSIKDWGVALGQDVAGGLKLVSDAVSAFRSGGITGLATYLQIPPAITTAINFAAQNVDALTGAMLGLGTLFAGNAIVTGLGAIGTALAAISLPMAGVIAGAALLGAAWNTNFGGIQEKTQAVWGVVQPVLTQMWTWVQTTLPAAFAAIAPAATTAWSAVQSAVSTAWGVIQPVLLQVQTWMQSTLPLSMSGIGASATTAWGSFSTAISTAWASAQAVFGQITASVSGLTIMLSAVFGPSLTRLGQSITSAFSGLGTLGPQFTGLQTAITNMITAVQPIIQGLGMVIGTVFGVVSIVAINGLSTLINNLPASIGIAIDQLTLTFNTIGDTLTAVVGIVTGLLSGDFAGAWESAKSLVSTSVTFMLGSLTNLSAMGALLMGSLKTFITGTFSDLASAIGIENITAQLQTVKDTVTTFFTGEGNVFSTAFSVIVDTPAWLSELTGWAWPALTDLLGWAWPDYDTWAWPDYLAFSWPDYNVFTWPEYTTPQWVIDLMNWSPVVSVTGAVSNAASGVASAVTDMLGITQHADGTKNFEGGWTWVGERGPELLNLPKGSEILSNTESRKMIGGLADGTTTAAGATGGKPWPVSGSTFGDLSVARQLGAAFTGTGEKIVKGFDKATKELQKGLESSLRKVPGLFGTSQVTDKQMKMAELGIPQEFADDWIRRLTDEVVNGVDWEGVDIKDAALRAGLDPALPANAILELVTEKWNDKSLFSDPKNLDLINQEAVQAALAAQAQQAAGEANLLGLFGITPEQAGVAGTATGTAAGGGLLTGLTQSLTGGNTGAQIATAIGTGVTPESMAPVGATVVSGLTTELQKDEYSAQMGTALSALFTSYLDKADAFADVAQRIMARIVSQFGNVTGLDIVAKFTDAFRTQLDADDAIASLGRVGEKILELVFRGYLAAAQDHNWAEGVNAKGDTTSQSTTTTTTPGSNARGTRSWRGGMTWVGETGPELVSLPSRSRIFNPAESMALAGAGGDVYVTVNASVASQIDIESLAYRISDVIRRRR